MRRERSWAEGAKLTWGANCCGAFGHLSFGENGQGVGAAVDQAAERILQADVRGQRNRCELAAA
jgi:hypothetical protein